jgi:hypothetical protein
MVVTIPDCKFTREDVIHFSKELYRYRKMKILEAKESGIQKESKYRRKKANIREALVYIKGEEISNQLRLI